MEYAKAIAAAVAGGLGTLGTALADGAVTPAEWVAVALATLVASGLVAVVPNRPPDTFLQ
jgi:hypothetical protein